MSLKAVLVGNKIKDKNAISTYKALKNAKKSCKGIRVTEVLMFLVHVHESKC